MWGVRLRFGVCWLLAKLSCALLLTLLAYYATVGSLMNSSNGSSNDSLLLQRCRWDWPLEICEFANIAGLISAAVWFLVLLPQVVRNFYRKSVEGLSLAWAIANFTAAFNNAFFVYMIDSMPLYSKISAVYMPVLEMLLLIQFWVFTPFTRWKVGATLICFAFWAGIAALQVVYRIFNITEWISIALWSAETFPQVFLNMRRQSTEGLALGMVILTTVGKTTDFLSTYLLLMPLQYVVMAYFSSTVAFLVTIQVIWYWGAKPKKIDSSSGDSDDNLDSIQSTASLSPACNCFRVALMVLLSAILIGFAAGIVWHTANWFSLFAPVGILLVITMAFLLTRWYQARLLRTLPNESD